MSSIVFSEELTIYFSRDVIKRFKYVVLSLCAFAACNNCYYLLKLIYK